jgi:4-hydroxythreonine-4-phosphate dehydrogenase
VTLRQSTAPGPGPRPLIALSAGDPAGIGPEIVAKALADEDVCRAVRVVVTGPDAVRPAHVPPLASGADVRAIETAAWLATPTEGGWELGRPQASAGRAALAALRAAHELARAGRVDALVSAPVAKEALHLAGERVEGQTELLGRWCETPDVEMLGIARELRVLLLTRHVALRAALAALSRERVCTHLAVLADGLGRLGFAAPRLALAGLNPHAGENGLFGDEERSALAPAVLDARARGLDVTGPLAPDTVFLRAAQGEFDGVLALYHDQAFIPLKLHAPGEGLTVLLGLPYLRVSPAHGTAFDIAGTGRADARNLRVALLAAARYARTYSSRAAAARV